MIPLWVVFGLGSAALSALMMLMQERLQIEGFALAFWIKVTCALVMLPFVLHYGVPENPLFYLALGVGAVMYAVSDVVFFRAIPKIGAGMVSRLLPSAVILSFLLWFLVNPALFQKYAAHPVPAGLIFLVLCASAWCAMHLTRCEVTRGAVRVIWFVIFAATVGPVLAKITTGYADIGKGPYAYVFFEALMMMTLWVVFFVLRRRTAPEGAGVKVGRLGRAVSLPVLLARRTVAGGMAIGCVAAGMILLNTYAYYSVDNPAYIPAVKFLDTIIIMAVYPLMGLQSRGNLVAGVGVVACAAALVALKAQIP